MKKNTNKQSYRLPPPICLESPKVSATIILTNLSAEERTVELFNKRNGLDFITDYTKMNTVTAAVFTRESYFNRKKVIGEFQQTYADFYESILKTGIIIRDLKFTNNKQVFIYRRDLVMGRVRVAEADFDGRLPIKDSTILNIVLLPRQIFKIGFTIDAKEKDLWDCVSL